MPPRRKASNVETSDGATQLNTATTTSATNTRSTRGSRSTKSTLQLKQDDPIDHDDDVEVKPTVRSKRAARASTAESTATTTTTRVSRANNSRDSLVSTTSTATATTRGAKASVKSRVPSTASTSAPRRTSTTRAIAPVSSTAARAARKRTTRASDATSIAMGTEDHGEGQTVDDDAGDERNAENHAVESEDDLEEEEEIVKPKTNRRGATKKRVLAPPSPASTVDIEEKTGSESEAEAVAEIVKPKGKAVRGKGKKAVPAPIVEEESEASEVEAHIAAVVQADSDDDVPIMKTPAKSQSRLKNKKPIIEDSPEAHAPSASEDEQLATPAPSQHDAEDSDEDVAADLLPQIETSQATAKPEAEADSKSAPASAPQPPVNVAPTAYDLAAAARNAALNHAAMEKIREKEREGKPRLVIHQLVLEDFKSYRGRGVIGPFHKSFSSIVGPNGSGKSNTIDALLFVFGYRATKMRQGKLSELIHNSGAVSDVGLSVGDENRQPQDMDGAEFEDSDGDDSDDFSGKKGKKGKKGKAKKSAPTVNEAGMIQSCTVEVWFREIIDLPGGRDEFEVVPNSQLVVARTAYRNNSSKYTINGRTSNYGEVTTLLKARGIDLDHKRFLILQGEVESIAQMKPKGQTEHDEGLLEYLEDIIGTSKYKKEIEDAVVEVDRLNDARAVQLNRVKLVERERSALEGRKKEADGYLRDQNELVHNQSALFQLYIHQADQNAQQHQEEVTVAEAELKEEIDAQADIRKEVETLQIDYDSLVKDTKEVEKATNEIVKQLAVLDRADVQLQEKKKSATTKIKKLRKTLQDDTHARSEADTWVRNHTETIERVSGEIEKMDSALEREEAELEKVRDGLKGKTEVFSTQIEHLQGELQPWASKIAEKQGEIDLVANERDLLKERSESSQTAIVEAEAALEKLGADDVTKRDRLQELLDEKQEIQAQIAEQQIKLDGMQAEDARLRNKSTAARQKADEAKASQSASRSRGNVLSSLTKLKEQGRLPGFHGRLGDLGRIDDKYDVAISTAAPGLDNLVTDTIAVGQACIEHLRKNDLGRANVMCLDRLSSRDMSRIQTPENAPRLFDLVTPKDPKLAPAFFQILTNTLVANDLDQGKRLAFGSGKRWRVVTLDGQLIDVSGTMSGGGGRPQKGRMSSKIAADEVTPEHVARCEQEQTVAVEALRVFLDDRRVVEKDMAGLRKRLPDVELSISKIEMDLKTSDKRVAEAEKRLAELRSQGKPEAGEAKKMAQFDKTIASLTKELESLRTQSRLIEEKIKVLQEKILEVGGVKLRGQQTKVQDLKAQIDLATDRLTKAEVGKNKSNKDATKLAKAIETNKAALESTEEELQELVQQIENGAAESEAVRKGVEQAQDVLSEKQEELAEMKALLDEKLAIVTQFRKREAELTRQRDEARKLLHEATRAVEHYADKLGDLQLNDLDDDDEDEVEGAAQVDKAGSVTDADPAQEEKISDATAAAKDDKELRQYTVEEIASFDVKILKATISALEERIANTNLDLSVLKEYARREREFMQRAADLEAVTKERDGAKQAADDLRNQRLREFMSGFGIISMKLKEMYQMITLGGNAELELVDSLDPFSEGIIFSVMPPKKSWKNISNLSGGEKTLSSLALVFALHVFKPTPLYFMDEIDAALDFRNVSIVANYIKDRTKNAQFIIISLRNNMFELSSRLIGIYKVANQTRSVAIDNTALSQVAVEAAG